MDIKELQRHWERFGRTDPLRAILTGLPEGGWKEEEFFRSGQQDVDAIFDILQRIDAVPRRGRALDFGAGVGRLTQALCERFDSVVGVDIAPAMVDLARRYNRFGDRCQYLVNQRDDLSLFPDGTFDFVYSLIVLQHMKPEYSRRYLAEFLRVASPGGIVAFQAPSHLRMERGRELPAAAFRALIELENPVRALQAVERWKLTAAITNASPERWLLRSEHQPMPLNLGNHWLDENGKVAVFDDARAPVRTEVLPGEKVRLDLLVTAPSVPGRYLLELDLVQEGIAWFQSRGSPTSRCPIDVRPGALQAEGTSDPGEARLQPRMEMHCLPRREVERLVIANGGEILDVREHHGSGASFESYQYVVVKRGRPSRLRRLGASIRWRLGQAHALLRRALAKVA